MASPAKYEYQALGVDQQVEDLVLEYASAHDAVVGIAGAYSNIADIVSNSTQPATGAKKSLAYLLEDVLRDALIESAQAEIEVRSAGWVAAKDVAEIRKDASTAGMYALDLQAMRTVNGIALNAPENAITGTIGEVRAWNGTAFGDKLTTTPVDTGVIKLFSEQLTERLLVQISPNSVNLENVQANAALSLPSPPSNLELKIGSKTLWAHPDAVKLNEDGLFSQSVDITQELLQSLESGVWPLELRLNASVPALLDLRVVAAFQRRHKVVLPGGSLAASFEEPGELKVSLPLPPDSASWKIHALELQVEGPSPEDRTLPARLPQQSAVVELVVGDGKALALRLPPSLLEPMEKLQALWLPLQVPSGSSELGGTLIGGRVDAPDPGTVLSFLEPLAPEGGEEWIWTRWDLAKPYRPEAGVKVWLEVQAIRGSVKLAPAMLPSESPTGSVEPSDARTAILRGLPGGPYQTFAAGIDAVTPEISGLIRVTGIPKEPGEFPVLIPHLPVTEELEGFTPEDGRARPKWEWDIPIDGSSLGGFLSVPLEARAAGYFRITEAVIFHTLFEEAAT